MSMGRHSRDQELKIGSTTKGLNLIRNEDGSAMYQVIEEIPRYRDPLLYTQANWIDGHGQHDFRNPEAYFEGQSIDTTQEGRVFLGPRINEVQESDDTNLDSTVVKFCWDTTNSKLILITSGKAYFYNKTDTTIDTDEALDTSETEVDCDADATTKIPVNSVIQIEDELMWVTTTGTTLTVIRGLYGTTKATHTTNTDIYISKWKAATTTVASATDLINYGAYIFAARGSSTAYMYSSDGGDGWTASGLTFNTVQKFLVAHNAAGTAEVLWAFKQPNEVYSNAGTGVTTTQWGSANYIGDTANNITNLFLSNDNFMVGREDGLFHFDSDGGMHQLRPDLRANRSTDNFKYVTDWQVGVYHSEIDGMGEITSYNAYALMGPLTGTDDIGRRGDIVGLAADKDWIYAAIYDGTNYWIYKGREVRKEGGLRWQFCPWVYCGTNAIATMLVVQHSATDRRLWFGYGTSTAYVILSDNPTDDSAARFCASGYLRMSYDYGTDPYWDKLWQSAIIETTGGATGETVQIKYRDDTDTSATECIAVHTTNGVHEVNFTTALTNKRIQFEIHLASNTNTATPEVSFFQAKGIEKPTTVRMHEATYSIGSEPGKSAETLRTFLRGGRTSTSLIRFADLRYGETTGGTAGTDFVYCILEPGYPQEVEIIHTRGQKPELGIRVRLREVSFT